MKSIKEILQIFRLTSGTVAIALAFFASFLHQVQENRAEARTGRLAANVNQGNFFVAADTNLTFRSPDRGSTTFGLGTELEYFFANRISAGAHLEIEGVGSFRRFLFGPSASWYFWGADQFALSLKSSFLFENLKVNNNADSLSRMNLNLGISGDYFFTPNVSFGPLAQMRFFFGDTERWNNDQRFEFALTGRFALYF